MSISLNNHESRIKKLESGGMGSWEKGSNSNGSWAKEKSTGLLIQWGSSGGNAYNHTVYFPLSFNTSPAVVCIGYGDRNPTGDDGTPCVRYVANNHFRSTTGTLGLTWRHWIAIGYLITNRLFDIAKYVSYTIKEAMMKCQLV